MRRIWIAAATLTFVVGGVLLWPQIMAANYRTPLRGWYPREDAGVLLVVRQAGHQEEMAFGKTRKAGVWLKAVAQNNRYDYASIKVTDLNDRGMEVLDQNAVFTREFEAAYALPWGRNFFEPGAPPEDSRRIAMHATFSIGYEAPRAAGGKATTMLQRTLKGPIEISEKRPMTFEPAVVKDLGFAVRARAEETDLRVMLVAIDGHQPRFAECWLHYVSEQPDGTRIQAGTKELQPVDGGLVASIPMSEIGGWIGQSLNTQIEVDVTAEGSAVTVTLK